MLKVVAFCWVHLHRAAQQEENAMRNENVARDILGVDFVTPEEMMSARPGIVYTNSQMAEFERTLPCGEELEFLRDQEATLVPGPQARMSLLDIRALRSEYFYCKNKKGWYLDVCEQFSHKDKVGAKWLKIRKKPASYSAGKNLDDMRLRLSGEGYVPNIAEVAWSVTSYRAVRNIRLFPHIFVWTSSEDSCRLRVFIGHNTRKGLSVNSLGDTIRYNSIGWAIAWK